MRLLDESRQCLDKLLPGLDSALSAEPLLTHEAPGGRAIELYRDHGGAGLLAPAVHGGIGAGVLDAYRVACAIGSRSPSLALAVTMHNFSVASLVPIVEASDGQEWMLLDAVANDNLLIASGFAEGRATQDILDPKVTAVQRGDSWRISGVKTPCSLSRSMNLLASSVRLEYEDGSVALGVAVVPADAEGITVEASWKSLVLTGAESDSVRLDDVEIPSDLVFEIEGGDEKYDNIQDAGLAWFTLLMCGSYLGAAGALVERAIAGGRGTTTARLQLLATLEAANLALESVAGLLDRNEPGPPPLGPSLVARQLLEDSIARAVPPALDLIGGIRFATEPEISYLSACVQGVRLHPPGGARREAATTSWYLGHG